MQPFITRITARTMSVFVEGSSHQDEEFIYALEGSIQLFLGELEPVELYLGDSVYFNNILSHGCISTSQRMPSCYGLAQTAHYQLAAS